MPFERACPDCGKPIRYKSKYGLKYAAEKGTRCLACGISYGRRSDLSGRQFGRLTVLRLHVGTRRSHWECKCVCGTEVTVLSSNLTSGNTRSCGCLAKDTTTRIDLLGQRFGKLVVVEFVGLTKYNQARWLCKCDCGKSKIICAQNLRSDAWGKQGTRSCGCDQYVLRVDPWKYVWHVYYNSAKATNREWTLSDPEFATFVASNCFYCGEPPSKLMSPSRRRKNAIYDTFRWNGIDRIDSSGGYTPGNTVPCCQTCNRMKSDLSHEEFLAHIDAVYTYQHSRQHRLQALPQSHPQPIHLVATESAA